MRRSATVTIAVIISALLLVVLAGAATASTGPGAAWIPAAGATAVPAQAGPNVAVPGVQIAANQADDLVRQREAAYQAQLDELTRRIQVGQERVAALGGQEQALNAQLAQLEQTRQERAASYQNQLGTLQEQFSQRSAQYTAQLQEIQSRLAEAKALLGQ